ncbi:MAG: hypothetical protein DHS80DRAFT_28340 [Piptocephalis tieghemiana]|nr:MAG: hypothetical protein DHS80DRAFT_28340 [Piptocephalis tieghemiana]
MLPSPSATSQKTSSFSRDDFSFLPQLTEVFTRLAEPSCDRQAIAAAMAVLNDRFQRCRQTVESLPGAEHSVEDLKALLSQRLLVLEMKRKELIQMATLLKAEEAKESERRSDRAVQGNGSMGQDESK